MKLAGSRRCCHELTWRLLVEMALAVLCERIRDWRDGRQRSDKRLSDYFIRRAIELLEAAKAENDPIRKLDIEARVARYWAIARTGD